MMVNTHEAKTQLSKLLERAAAGEDIIIAKSGKPVARLVAYRDNRARRRPGLWRGEVQLEPDFDTTPRHVIRAFETE